MKKQILSSGAVLAAVLMSAASANAASFTLNATDGACGSFGCTSSVAGAINIDFESGLPTTGFAQYSSSGNAGINLSGAAAPAQDTSKFLGVGTNASVTINFGEAVDYFGLYWGSIDNYNFVDLYKGGNLLATITGLQAAATPNGNQTSPTTNRYIDIFANDISSTFDKVMFRSTGFAFEIDNNAYRRAVPVPGLAVGAFVAGVGLLARKRQVKA
jgi:hypothetical protein